MKQTLKNIPVLGPPAVKLYSHILRIRDRKFLKKNGLLKNLWKGERCFIIATGPSIKEQDLKILKGEHSISVSNFFVHPDFREVAPEFHLFVPSHLPVTKEQYGEWFKESAKIFPKGQKVFVALSDKDVVENSNAYADHDVHYYQPSHHPLREDERIELTKSIPLFQTSVHIAIFVAIYLGAKEINLLGIDHDWILHLGESRHFYDEKESSLSRAGYNEWSVDLEHEFQSYVFLWQRYKEIRKWAKKNEVDIFNLSKHSLLDIIPRKKLEETIKR